MADLKINTSSLNKMHKNILETIENLDNLLKEMYKSVNDLHTTWEGPNHERFVSDFKKKYENMKKVNRSLNVYADAVKRAKEQYEKTEEEIMQIMNR